MGIIFPFFKYVLDNMFPSKMPCFDLYWVLLNILTGGRKVYGAPFFFFLKLIVSGRGLNEF